MGWERSRLYPSSRPSVISHVGTHSHIYGEGGRCQGSGIVPVSRLGIWLAGVRIHVDLRFIHVPDSWEVLLPDGGHQTPYTPFIFLLKSHSKQVSRAGWADSRPLGFS